MSSAVEPARPARLYQCTVMARFLKCLRPYIARRRAASQEGAMDPFTTGLIIIAGVGIVTAVGYFWANRYVGSR